MQSSNQRVTAGALVRLEVAIVGDHIRQLRRDYATELQSALLRGRLRSELPCLERSLRVPTAPVCMLSLQGGVLKNYWRCLPRNSVQSRHIKTIVNPQHGMWAKG